MTTDSIRDALRAGRPVVSAWSSIPDPLVAEALAAVGYDAVTLDLQHGVGSDADLLSLLQAIDARNVPSLVRIPWNEPKTAMRALDLGAHGVIAPMIRHAGDVRDLVAACRYAPDGIRSFGPTRANLAFGPDYGARANDLVTVAAMIETRSAFEALDEVLAVPGLDMAFVGPADLSQALGGRPGADFEDGPVADALDRIVERCRAHGVAAGLFCRSPEYARAALVRGFAFVTADSDLAHLQRGASAALRTVRG
ncbi:MAG: aldolase/citrate lyase family protein [Trueperaceae bacterium]